MKNKEFFDDVESAFYIGREIYFTIGDIEYHLDYEEPPTSEEEDYVIIFNQDTGEEYYFGPKKGRLR